MGTKKGKKGKGMKMKKIQQRISFDYISDAAKNSKLFLQLLYEIKQKSVLMKEKTYRKFSLMKRSENSMQEHFVRLFRTQQKTQKV